MRTDDILVHRTRNTPKCATVVLLDMSGSMRYNGLYIDVKRMGLALHGLIHRRVSGRSSAVRRDLQFRQAAANPAKSSRCCPSR